MGGGGGGIGEWGRGKESWQQKFKQCSSKKEIYGMWCDVGESFLFYVLLTSLVLAIGNMQASHCLIDLYLT